MTGAIIPELGGLCNAHLEVYRWMEMRGFECHFGMAALNAI